MALVIRTWTGALAVATVGGFMIGGVGLATVGLAVTAASPAAALWALRDRADEQLEAALGPIVESVARSVRSGAGLPQAVGEAAADAPPELADDLQAIRATALSGGGFVPAVDRWTATRPLPGVRLAAAALALAAEAGGPPSKPLEGVAVSLQERTALRREIRALSAQARLSAMVIVLAPVAFAVLAAGIDSNSARFLLTTTVGQLCLAAGIALDALGALWMHRITTGAAS